MSVILHMKCNRTSLLQHLKKNSRGYQGNTNTISYAFSGFSSTAFNQDERNRHQTSPSSSLISCSQLGKKSYPVRTFSYSRYPVKTAGNHNLSSMASTKAIIRHFQNSTWKSSSGSISPNTDHNPPDDSKNKTRLKKLGTKCATLGKKGGFQLKEYVQKYGIYFIGTYFTIWGTVIGSLFFCLDNGIIDPASLPSFGGADDSLPDITLSGGNDTSAKDDNIQDDSADFARIFADYFQQWEFTEPFAKAIETNPRLANFSVAFVATKFTEPIRIGVAVFLTPRVARFFGKKEEDETEGEESENGKEKGLDHDSDRKGKDLDGTASNK